MSAFHKAAVEMRTTSSQDETSVSCPFCGAAIRIVALESMPICRAHRKAFGARIVPGRYHAAVCDKPTIAHWCHCHFAYFLRPHSRSAAALETWLYGIEREARVWQSSQPIHPPLSPSPTIPTLK